MKLKFILVIILFYCISCTEKRAEVINKEKETINKHIVHKIDTVALKKCNFYQEMIYNGKIKGHFKSNLNCKVPGDINEVFILEGQRVSKGQVLIKISNDEILIALEKARNELRKATQKMDVKIIEFGGELGIKESISERALEVIKIQTGYYDALTGLKKALIDSSYTVIKSPIDGYVSDFTIKKYNPIQKGDKICQVVNLDNLDVDFYILEEDILLLKKKGIVKVTTFFNSNNETITGEIASINPVVTDKGMIHVTAMITNNSIGFVDGSNAKVSFAYNPKNMFCVPKSAVLTKGEKRVLFTYEQGYAKWKEITIEYENETSYGIVGEIKKGDYIIIGKNGILAHDAPVSINKI